MLTELYINNFAIIEDLSIPFEPGLNILTGETGAGKSIIIAALGLIAGKKSSSDVVRHGSDEASVVAAFDLERISPELISQMKDRGYNIDGELIIKRSVNKKGKSRAFVNGQPITVTELKSISGYLLEISSQHEHQKLLDENAHLEFVDRFGDTSALITEYKTEYEKYFALKDKLRELEKLSAASVEQTEFLKFQINEIELASLVAGEDEELQNELNIVKHSARLFENVKNAEQVLYSDDDCIESKLSEISEKIQEASSIDSKIKNWVELCDQAQVAVQELSRGMQDYLSTLNIDPNRLDEIESRIFELNRLKKKYGGTIEDVLAKLEELKQKLSMIENCDEEIASVQNDLVEAKSSLLGAGNRLSKVRKSNADKLSKMVQFELDGLGLRKTTFSAKHAKLDIDSADSNGLDRFVFEISPNQGEPLKPLAAIASGGELSRILLAIKCVLIKKINLAVLEVFDEVDVGIGGSVAEVVGEKLMEMSDKRQIVCITHLPQVASFGSYHMRVSKEVVNGRTVTRFDGLDEKNRIDEIARMLGGSDITETAINHAKEMLVRSVNGFAK